MVVDRVGLQSKAWCSDTQEGCTGLDQDHRHSQGKTAGRSGMIEGEGQGQDQGYHRGQSRGRAAGQGQGLAEGWPLAFLLGFYCTPWAVDLARALFSAFALVQCVRGSDSLACWSPLRSPCASVLTPEGQAAPLRVTGGAGSTFVSTGLC